MSSGLAGITCWELYGGWWWVVVVYMESSQWNNSPVLSWPGTRHHQPCRSVPLSSVACCSLCYQIPVPAPPPPRPAVAAPADLQPPAAPARLSEPPATLAGPSRWRPPVRCQRPPGARPALSDRRWESLHSRKHKEQLLRGPASSSTFSFSFSCFSCQHRQWWECRSYRGSAAWLYDWDSNNWTTPADQSASFPPFPSGRAWAENYTSSSISSPRPSPSPGENSSCSSSCSCSSSGGCWSENFSVQPTRCHRILLIPDCRVWF